MRRFWLKSALSPEMFVLYLEHKNYYTYFFYECKCFVRILRICSRKAVLQSKTALIVALSSFIISPIADNHQECYGTKEYVLDPAYL
jgi:hypothetical protein